MTGDFNLDYAKKYRPDNIPDMHLDDCSDYLGLVQLVNFPTWSRLVNGSLRSSVLDHVYCNDATLVDHIIIRTLVGDHNLVHFNIKDEQGTPKMYCA